MNATWLILPVVICLSQRLSHACDPLEGKSGGSSRGNSSSNREVYIRPDYPVRLHPSPVRLHPSKTSQDEDSFNRSIYEL
ncbi:hypothetical protein YC2023_082740 [Brassica napus]